MNGRHCCNETGCFPNTVNLSLYTLEYISANIFSALGCKDSSFSYMPTLQARGPEFDPSTHGKSLI